MKFKFRSMLPLLFVLLFPLSAQENAKRLPAVVAASAIPMEFTAAVMEIGETKAEDSVDLVARVDGYLTKVNFNEGGFVKKGTLLFEIDSSEYEAKVAQTEAALAKAKAQLAHDATEEKRQGELFRKNAISEKEYAHYQSKKLESEAEVQEKEASLRLAKLNLDYTKIYAPFDGYMGFKTCSVGNMVGPQSDKLGTIEKSGKIKVDFSISENDAIRLTKYVRTKKLTPADVPVEIYLQDGRKIDLKGIVGAWDNHVNAKTGTLKLQAIFDDPGRTLIPGFYVRVKLRIGEPEKRIAVRQSAVSTNVIGSSIFVLKDISGSEATVEQRYVKIFSEEGSFYYLQDGLKENELVIVSGIQRVRNGAKCTFTQEGMNPAAFAKVAE